MIASINAPSTALHNFAPDPGDIQAVWDVNGNELHDGRNDADFDDFSSKAKTLTLESADASFSDNKEVEAKDITSKDHTVGAINRYVTPKDFDLLKVIGMGAFGKVLQVRNRQNQEVLAMKIISKRLLKRNAGYVENVQSERDILTKIRHPFVVTMHCSFQTKEKLFIIMDFLAGGELFLRLGREGIFLESTAAFYLGEITLALDHLHTRGVLHRDLKPENILLCSDGHVCVTDFGLARDLSSEAGFGGFSTEEDESRARTVCGTQEYMSPEMLSRKGYGRASDWWSLGCIAFEMLSGRPPFESRKGAKDLFRKIMSERVKMPDGATAAACKLLKGLLNRDVTKRWGASRSTMFEVGGVAGLKAAEFFKHIDWEKLERKEIEPPDRKPVENDEDLRHFYDEFKEMPLPRSVTDMSHGRYTPCKVKSDTFRGFSFVHEDFPLPDRKSSEIEHYYNHEDVDGESDSEVASSKMGEEKDAKNETANESDKKKRPPRKRNKKKVEQVLSPMESRTITPEASEVGEPEIVPPGIKDESKEKSEFLATTEVNMTLEIEISSLHNKPKELSLVPSLESKARESLPQKQNTEDWSHVSLADRKGNPVKKKIVVNQPQIQKSLSAAQRITIQPVLSPGKLQTSFSQQQMLISNSKILQNTHQPAPGSWAAMAQSRATAEVTRPISQSSALLKGQSKHSLAMVSSNKSVPIKSEQSATHSRRELFDESPTPSGDWRNHSLRRNSPAISVKGSLQSRQSWGIDVPSNSFPNDSRKNPHPPLNHTDAIGKAASVPPTIDEFPAFSMKTSKKNESNGIQPQGIWASRVKK